MEVSRTPFAGRVRTFVAVTAAKSKLLHREGKDNEATTNGHADVEEDSDTSLKRRNKMQVAAPDTVMQRGLGYSKAAHYATINRTDVAGAQVHSRCVSARHIDMHVYFNALLVAVVHLYAAPCVCHARCRRRRKIPCRASVWRPTGDQRRSRSASSPSCVPHGSLGARARQPHRRGR